MKKVIATLCVMTLAWGSVTAQNLLSDPGFESNTPGAAGGIGGWEFFNGAEFSTEIVRTGTYSGKFYTKDNVPGAFEALPAAPGEVYTLTGWGYMPVALESGTVFGGIQISYFDDAGTDLGTVEAGPGTASADFQMFPGQPVGEWIPMSITATAPAGTTKIQPFGIFIEFGSTAVDPQGFYLDDMSLVLVPEPSTFAFLGGLLALGFVIYRKRK